MDETEDIPKQRKLFYTKNKLKEKRQKDEVKSSQTRGRQTHTQTHHGYTYVYAHTHFERELRTAEDASIHRRYRRCGISISGTCHTFWELILI